MPTLFIRVALFSISVLCFFSNAKAQTGQRTSDQGQQQTTTIRFDYDGLQPKPQGMYALVEDLGEGWHVVQMSEIPNIRRQTSNQEVLYVKLDLSHIRFLMLFPNHCFRSKLGCPTNGGFLG